MWVKAIPHAEHRSEGQGLRDKPVSCPNTDDSNRTLIIPSPLCLQAPAHVAGQPTTPSVTAPQLHFNRNNLLHSSEYKTANVMDNLPWTALSPGTLPDTLVITYVDQEE